MLIKYLYIFYFIIILNITFYKLNNSFKNDYNNVCMNKLLSSSIFCNINKTFHERAENIINYINLNEKINLLSNKDFGIKRINISKV